MYRAVFTEDDTENLTGILRALRLGLRHAGYCIERMMGRAWGTGYGKVHVTTPML